MAAAKFSPFDQGPAPGSVADILAWYDREFPAVLARLRALPPEHFAQDVTFTGGFTSPAFGYLMLSNNHTVHHRGQLSAYLQAMGVKVPAIYGGSADEPFQPPQTSG